jgi:hypothetical protein
MKMAFSFVCVACMIAILSGCAPQTKAIRPDWQNVDHQRVWAQLTQVLHGSDRDPAQCKIFLFETASLNAVSAGECTFGFSTGLVGTRDERLIRGVAAHEVAHEVLGHADKRKAAAAVEQAVRTAVSFIPGIGGLIATSAVLVTGIIALPTYSRAQEAEADAKAVEILQRAGEHDPPGTMAYTLRTLLAWHGPEGGGLLDTHPGTGDRLAAMGKLGHRQEPVEATRAASISEESAPPPLPTFQQVAEEVETSPGRTPASSRISPSRGSSAGQPSGESAPGRGAGVSPAQESSKATIGDTSAKSHVPAPRRAVRIEELDHRVSVRDLGRRADTAVVLVYREGSPSSKRFEGHLRKVVDRFAGRARFFRSEIRRTAAELVGPGARSTPILIIVRNGKEFARTRGVPARAPGKPAGEALADWLTEHLDRNPK